MKRFFKILRLIAVNFIVFIFLCLLLEIGFRTMCYFKGQGFFRRSNFVSPWITTYDIPPPIEIDTTHGFFRHRLYPVSKKKVPGTYRIIAVGGSTTANERAWAAGHVDYTSLTEELLNAEKNNPIHYEVLNAGADAYSTAHSLVNIAFRLIEYEPDMIILMHNINDSSVIGFGNGPTPDYSNKYLLPIYLNPELQSGLSFEGFLYQSRLLCYLGVPQMRVEKSRVIKFDNPPEAGLAFFRRNLRSIASVCNGHGIRLLLLTQPHQNQEHKYVKLHVIKQYNQAILQEADQMGVPCLDMNLEFGNNAEFFCDMFHYSPDGTKRFARILEPVIWKITANIK